MTGRVVHVADKVEGAVYIGRAMPRQRLKASPFANPHKIGSPSVLGGVILGREGALFNYVEDLMHGSKRHLLAELPELRDKPLACWCRHDGVPMTTGVNDDGPDNRCHGDLLVRYLDTWTDDELREMAKEIG